MPNQRVVFTNSHGVFEVRNIIEETWQIKLVFNDMVCNIYGACGLYRRYKIFVRVAFW